MTDWGLIYGLVARLDAEMSDAQNKLREAQDTMCELKDALMEEEK